MSGKRSKALFDYTVAHKSDLVAFFKPNPEQPYNLYRMVKNYYHKHNRVPEL